MSITNQPQCYVCAKCLTKFPQMFKVKENSFVFFKTRDLTFFLGYCFKNGNYYLIKLGVGQQEIETENMSFQDFFVIKDPLHQMIPFPGINLNEHIKNSRSTKAPLSSRYI